MASHEQPTRNHKEGMRNLSNYTFYGNNLGDGVHSIVNLALCKSTLSRVACKRLLLKKYSHDRKKVIERGAKEMCNLAHKNLLRGNVSFPVESDLMVVMPFVRKSVSYIMNKLYNQGLPEDFIAVILKEVLEALDFIHKNNCVHKGVKASNIFLGEDGCKLSDYGISSAFYKVPQGYHVSGTYWLPPELKACVHRKYTAKTDIWMLGITALEMAGGSLPKSHGRVSSSPARFSFSEYILVHNQDPKFTQSFMDMVNSCLHPIPAHRPTAMKLSQTPFFINSHLPTLNDIFKEVEVDTTRAPVEPSSPERMGEKETQTAKLAPTSQVGGTEKSGQPSVPGQGQKYVLVDVDKLPELGEENLDSTEEAKVCGEESQKADVDIGIKDFGFKFPLLDIPNAVPKTVLPPCDYLDASDALKMAPKSHPSAYEFFKSLPIDKARECVDSLSRMVSTLERSEIKPGKLQPETRDQYQQMESLQNDQNEWLKAKVQQQADENDKLKVELQKLQNEKQDKSIIATELKKANEQIKQDKSELVMEMEIKEEITSILKQDKSKLEMELKKANEKMSILEQDKAKLGIELEKQKEEISVLLQHKSEGANELEKQKKEISVLKQDKYEVAKELEKEISVLKQDKSGVAKELEKQKEEISVLKQEVAKELEKKKEEFSILAMELGKEKETNSVAEKNISELTKNVSELTKNVSELTKELDKGKSCTFAKYFCWE